MQDYKSLRVAVMVCTTLVNTQTDNIYQTSYSISSAGRAKNESVFGLRHFSYRYALVIWFTLLVIIGYHCLQ